MVGAAFFIIMLSAAALYICKAFLVREENFEIYKVMQIQQLSPAN